jgi:hypothetical protein
MTHKQFFCFTNSRIATEDTYPSVTRNDEQLRIKMLK